MSIVHHYASVETTRNGYLLSVPSCETCGEPAPCWCLNCLVPMCTACLAYHPKATYMGTMAEAQLGGVTYPLTHPRLLKPAQVLGALAMVAYLALFTVMVLILFRTT